MGATMTADDLTDITFRIIQNGGRSAAALKSKLFAKLVCNPEFKNNFQVLIRDIEPGADRDFMVKARKFKYAYDANQVDGFCFIYKIRRNLSWTRKEFDQFFDVAMTTGIVAAHPGNVDDVTWEQQDDCYWDFNSDLYVMVSWRGFNGIR